ncbi:hypothetical protein N658DRAFT_97299 [Parathielavia hyrcaniae]|uniref:Uncharacterized protein n=1 Tax=Parathielavia hyrcaniae TaxID=113614 RepID=A0AAN6Q1E7_9PEZI|nr:hypothetical protein N658DRAFT_97299 [Parathielavia hyrcaniae]
MNRPRERRRKKSAGSWRNHVRAGQEYQLPRLLVFRLSCHRQTQLLSRFDEAGQDEGAFPEAKSFTWPRNGGLQANRAAAEDTCQVVIGRGKRGRVIVSMTRRWRLFELPGCLEATGGCNARRLNMTGILCAVDRVPPSRCCQSISSVPSGCWRVFAASFPSLYSRPGLYNTKNRQ